MKGKISITRHLRAAVAAALLGGIFSLSPAALALPVGGMSVGGTATISESNGNMTIAGTASGNLLTWVDFSIASGERVDFTGEHTYLNMSRDMPPLISWAPWRGRGLSIW